MSTISLSEAIGKLRVFEENMKGRHAEKGEEEQLMLTRAQWESIAVKDKKNADGAARNTKRGGWRGSGRGCCRGQSSGCGEEADKKVYKKFDKSKIKCFN